MPHRGSGSGIHLTLSLRSDLGILRAMGPTLEQLQKLEQDVVMALEHADPSSLDVLGFGEISVVLRTRTEDGEFVAKRLPPFKNQAILDRYEDNLNTYLGKLTSASVNVIPTSLTSLPSPTVHSWPTASNHCERHIGLGRPGCGMPARMREQRCSES